MGANLCCLKSSQPPLNPRDQATCSTIVIVKSPERVAMQTLKRVYEEDDEKIGDRGSVTLKEWLVKSPNYNLGHHGMNPTTTLQVVDARSSPSQVMSSPEVRSIEFYTPRISFSLETKSSKLEKVDERDEDEDKGDGGLMSTPILKRNPSQKGKKTVSFQETDIFFFYSPRGNFEDN